jgi:hypothetical protein
MALNTSTQEEKKRKGKGPKEQEERENRKERKRNRERKERLRGSLKQGREFKRKINREYKGINHWKTKEERKNKNTRGEGKRRNLSLRYLKQQHRCLELPSMSHDTTTDLHRSTTSEAVRPARHRLLYAR